MTTDSSFSAAGVGRRTLDQLRVAIVHPGLLPEGGGNALTAWSLQALQDTCDLTLLTLREVHFGAVNAVFGTALREGGLRVELASTAAMARMGQAVMRRIGANGMLWAMACVTRELRRIEAQRRFDVLLCTFNEMDFGRRGIQYVHFPYRYALPTAFLEAEDPPSLAVRVYHRLCNALAPISLSRTRDNLTLTNSRHTAAAIRNRHGIEATILYPPVAAGFPDVPWQQREDGFVVIGRIGAYKRLVDAVDIVRRLRERGHPLRLHLIGTRDEEGYETQLRAINEPWMQLHLDLPRREMVRLVASQRFALHVMPQEDFGIAVAEAMRAGCVPFARQPGGPAEILGEDPLLLFADVDDALVKIERVLLEPDTLDAVRQRLHTRRDLFSEDRFMHELRQIVETFANAQGS